MDTPCEVCGYDLETRYTIDTSTGRYRCPCGDSRDYEELIVVVPPPPPWKMIGIAAMVLVPLFLLLGIIMKNKPTKPEDKPATTTTSTARTTTETTTIRTVTIEPTNDDGLKGTYVGPVDDNEDYHGKGCLKWDDGRSYDGNWEHGVMSGYGKMRGFDEDPRKPPWTYTGYFSENMQHGDGEMVWDNGDKFKGVWKKGLRDGDGVFIKANGDKLKGKWVDGLCQGEGTYYSALYPNGRKGIWKDNKLIRWI